MKINSWKQFNEKTQEVGTQEINEIDTWLPIFTGFYGTIFEADEDFNLENYNEDSPKEITFDDVEWDYKTYHNEIGECATKYIEKSLNEVLNTKIILNFQGVISPRQYNHSNDAINIGVDLPSDAIVKIKKLLTDNSDAFDTYLKSKYTSYPGFNPLHSSDVDVWLEDYINKIDKKPHYLGALLEAVLYCSEPDEYTEENMRLSCEEIHVSGDLK